MSFGHFICCVSLASAAALAVEGVTFDLASSPEILIAPPARPAESLVAAQIEPTKYDRLVSDLSATDKWEQGFVLAAWLPIDETFTLKQDFRTGLQSETVLGQALAATYRDALAVMEKTSAELKASEAVRIAAAIQQQWLANNQVPFAEITTYGAEAAITANKTTTLKLQSEWQQREEAAATDTTAQETYRLLLAHELLPKRLHASTAVSLVHSANNEDADRETLLRKIESALRWTPMEQTAFTLGGEFGDQGATVTDTTGATYLLKLQQQIFRGAKVEVQGGYEQRLQETAEEITRDGAWNLGANSDFTLRDEWAAGVGLRYRQRDDVSLQRSADEVSFSLSVKGKF